MRINVSTLILVLLFFSCTEQKKEEEKAEVTEVSEPLMEEAKEPIKLEETAGPKTTFRKLSLLQGKLQLEIPSQLRVMEAEMFLLKYPMENPESTTAYSNEDGTVSLLISPRQEKATQADLPKYQQMLYESFGKNAMIDFQKSEIKKINGRDFIVLEMITPAVDTRVYNQMFITSLGGRLLMCTFNCTVRKQREWQPIAEQILSLVNVQD